MNANVEKFGLNGKDAIQVKMDSITKRNVFELVMPTPPNIKPND